MTEIHEEAVERIPLDDENDLFFERLTPVLTELYDSARAKNELDFVRTIAVDLWNSDTADTSVAAEAQMVFNDYMMYLDQVDFTRINLRIMLGFYCQLARGAANYEIVGNLLRIVGGGRYQEWPFESLPSGPTVTNSGDVLRVLADQAASSGRAELAEVLSGAFNEDLVSSYERADLLVREDGIRLLHKDGGEPAFLTLAEFHAWFERGISFFELLRKVTAKYLTKYQTEKKILGRFEVGPEQEYTVRADLKKRKMIITG
jgi:hypothetical protein